MITYMPLAVGCTLTVFSDLSPLFKMICKNYFCADTLLEKGMVIWQLVGRTSEKREMDATVYEVQ